MKILFISSWFPSKIESTNGNFVQRQAEAVALLHEVEIMHAVGDPDQKQKYISDERTINGIRTFIVYYKNSRNPALNFIRRMRAYHKGFLRMQKPDLVHANILHNSMLFAVYLKKRYRIPFVVTEHWSLFLQINRHKLSFMKLRIARLIARQASFIVPVSKNLRDDLEALKIGKKFRVVGNVVDTDLFFPKREDAGCFKFLHISNLIPLKRPDDIIEAAVLLRKEFENFELHIGGDGDIDRLNQIIKDHQATDYIKTFGELSHEEVAEKMSQSNGFILFSEYENLPCVLLESISSGVPVIATNVGGVPEIVKANHGIVIGKSTEELHNAMRNMLNGSFTPDSPEELHHYIAEHFSMLKIAEKFNDIYKSVG